MDNLDGRQDERLQWQIFAPSLRKRMGNFPEEEIEKISKLLFANLSPLLGEQMESLPEEEIEKISLLFLEKLIPEVVKRVDDLDDKQQEIIIKCSLEKMTRAFFKDYEIIWHDPNVNSRENQQYLGQLEKLCKVKTFTEWKEAKNYIKTAKAICHVITSGTNGEFLVKEIFSSANVQNVLTFCRANKDHHSAWAKNYKKDLCTETKIEAVISHIQKNLAEWQKQTSSFKFDLPAFAPIFDENHKSDMNHLHRYLKVIPNFHNREQARSDFLELSKVVYTGEEDKQNIARFEQTYDEYSKEKILNWYTRDSFLYRMVNNCLRIATSDSIQYSRFILKDLEKAIKDQYQKKSKDFSGLLYRGAYLSDKEWSDLKSNVNREIETHGFLSVSKHKDVALNFLKKGDDPSKKIFITILVPKGPNEEEQGFAELGELSEHSHEHEVLFNVRSRFTVLETEDGAYRHLVLLYGAQGFRKFVAEENPVVSIEGIENISGSRCQGQIDEMTENMMLFKSLRDPTKPIYSCKGCLDPKLGPFLCVPLKGKSPMTVKGCLLISPRQPQIPFYLYKCSKCGVKDQRQYFVCTDCYEKKMKWCRSCFGNTLSCIESGHSVLLETSPFSFWSEKMPENELNHLKYQTDLVKNSDHVFQQAQMYFETHEYDKAVQYYEAYIGRNEGKDKDVYLATSYSNLGVIYEKQGKLEKALEYSLKSLDLSKAVHGENDPLVATSYNNVGLVYEKLEKYKEALANYFPALDIFKSAYGERHPDVAVSYNNIGMVYSKMVDKYDEALMYHFKALDIEKSLYGENHPLVATSYSNIGKVYGEQEEYEKALEYFLKALDIDSAKIFILRISILRNSVLKGLIHGEKHPDIANSYNNIGFIYGRLEEFMTAHEYFLKALGIYRSIYGEIHPSVAMSYKKRGEVYLMQEEDDKALECFFKSLDIEKSVYGDSHLEIAISYSNIGSVYRDQGDSHKALEYNLKSLDTYKSVHGEKHPDVALSYENIAAIYVEQKDYKTALEYSLKSLEIYKSLYGENDPQIAASSKILAFISYKQGEYKQSVEYDLKALEIRRRVYGENDPKIAADFKTIGATYEKQEKYIQALEYYVKSLNILKSVHGENHPQITALRDKIHKINEICQDVTQLP